MVRTSIKDKTYRQNEGASDEDMMKEYVGPYDKPRAPDDFNTEYEKIMLRKMKRIDDLRKKKDMESTYHIGKDRPIKDRYSTGHVGYADRTHLPMDRLPEMLAYEQLGEIHEPFTTWRCPSCGTLHHKAVPEYWDRTENRIKAGCSFCGDDSHWLNRIDFKRI